MNPTEIKKTAAQNLIFKFTLFTLGISCGVLLIKSYAAYHTQSTALLSDAMESVVNVFTALFALWIVRIAQSPADQDHPYGHGKFESLSVIFEGGLITLAGLFIIQKAWLALWSPQSLQHFQAGWISALLALLINALWGTALIWTGNNKQSLVLTASGWHLLSDVLTTLGALLGLYLSYQWGWLWADPLIAILLALSLGYTGVKLIRQSLHRLLDRADLQQLAQVAKGLQSIREPGFIDLHQTKVLQNGDRLHIDAHLVVPRYWSVEQAHQFVEIHESRFFKETQTQGEFHFHLDPCRNTYCRHCNLDDCTLRTQTFEKALPLETYSLIRAPEEHLL